jgi:hypothetical protein
MKDSGAFFGVYGFVYLTRTLCFLNDFFQRHLLLSIAITFFPAVYVKQRFTIFGFLVK